jgi:hypothetical protein
MSTTLQGLPAEILGKIAENLFDWNRRSLGHLRLTCREIHAKTMFQFGASNFKRNTVHVHPGGLYSLSKVTRHRHFRSHVREICLDTDSLISWNGTSDLLLESSDAENDSELLSENAGSEENSDVSRETLSVDSGDDPLPVFDQSVLDFVHNGDFARQFRVCIKPFVNLEQLEINQPDIEGDLTQYQLDILRAAWSAVIATLLSTIRKLGIHLKKFAIRNYFGTDCPPSISVLRSISRTPGLLDSMTDLHLQLYVAETKRKQNPGRNS